uniref:Uncharacterized protein n=1 Tax=Periophthalmus magnuspinnatus TaxID=409849 RepID=A0A3B4B340_9GOBI
MTKLTCMENMCVTQRVCVSEVEAQQEALAAVEAVVQGLSPDQQVVLRQQLDQVLSCVTSLRSEVAELRGGLQDIGVEDSQRIRRRRHYIPRERTDSTTSSSVYFTASQGLTSTYETSEGGYSTANAESDYTDRETDREEPEQGADPESEGEDQSCATVITLKQHDSQDEDLDGDTETPSGELALLLAQSDILHTGDSRLKEEGYKLLQDNRAEYDDNREFVWRLARAHSDMYWCTGDPQSRRSLAQQGLEEAELCDNDIGVSQEHLDRALALTNTDPVCFYLLAKWCYQVATLNWLEKKAAAALYQSPPSSSLQQALDNFLKAEELSPGFSKTVRLYIAKVTAISLHTQSIFTILTGFVFLVPSGAGECVGGLKMDGSGKENLPHHPSGGSLRWQIISLDGL